MMMQPYFNPLKAIMELVFTLIFVIFCFLIYRKTKESYELTKYEGIRHFRDAFLYFGLSYIFRFLLSILMLSIFTFDILNPRFFVMPLFILVMGYFSTMGIFYLLISTAKEQFSDKRLILFGHVTAVVVSVVSFFTRSHFMLLYLQSVILVLVLLLGFSVKSTHKRFSQIRVLYILTSVLWLLNLFSTELRSPYTIVVEGLVSIISIIVLVVIYRKILKWIR